MGTQVVGPNSGDKHGADNTVQIRKIEGYLCVTFAISMEESKLVTTKKLTAMG